MRVLIADDAAPVRSALRRLLAEVDLFHCQFTIIAEAVNFAELMRLARAHQPELILLDWELSGLPATTKRTSQELLHSNRSEKKRNVILASLRRLESQPAIIILSSLPEDQRLAHNIGADGFVCKGDPPEILVKAIQQCIA